jgi:RNA-directed DNA polymerase
VLCNGTKAEAQAIKEELKGLLSTMGLTLSEEKTKVTHITEGFNFLGYRVIRELGRNGKMVSKVLIPEKAMKQFQNKIREILAPDRAHESTNAKILALNRLIRGWCEYYRCTSGPSQVFGKLSDHLFRHMAHWLGRKYKRSMPVVMQRFREGNTFRTKTLTLKMPREYKAKYFVAQTWHNPYTEIHHRTIFFG